MHICIHVYMYMYMYVYMCIVSLSLSIYIYIYIAPVRSPVRLPSGPAGGLGLPSIVIMCILGYALLTYNVVILYSHLVLCSNVVTIVMKSNNYSNEGVVSLSLSLYIYIYTLDMRIYSLSLYIYIYI